MYSGKMISVAACLFIAAAFAGPALAADELNWAQELVRSIENTTVHHNETVNYGRYKFVSGPAINNVLDKDAIKAVTPLEGKVSLISYKGTDKNSPFEIFSVYKNYLKQNKFEIVYACEKTECGNGFKGLWYGLNPFERLSDQGPIIHASEAQQHYIAAKKKIAGKDTYVSVLAFIAGWWNIPMYRVDVAQVDGLTTETVPASKISEAILSEGRMALYGITFDTGKSEIKPESDVTLAELAAFLKASGEVFYVVGHTDGQGSLADNMKLAQDRAGAVKETLIGKYGVPAAMLSAHGGGPLSPLATNSTEAGRALNRRVEIVKEMGKSGPAAPAAAVTTQPAPQAPTEVLSTGPKPQEPSQAQAALAAAQAKVATAKAAVSAANTKKAAAKTLPEKMKAMAEAMKADAALRVATQELAKAQAQVRAEAQSKPK